MEDKGGLPEWMDKNKSIRPCSINRGIFKLLVGDLFQASIEQGKVANDFSGVAVVAIHGRGTSSIIENSGPVILVSILRKKEKLMRAHIRRRLLQNSLNRPLRHSLMNNWSCVATIL